MTGTNASTLELLDTCILVYAYDEDEGAKHETARELLKTLMIEGKLVLSVQVLNEFYRAATKASRAKPFPHERVHDILSHLAASCTVLPLTSAETFRALDAMQQNSLAFWDALIWAVAAENDVSVVYTEDFQHGRVIDGVRFCNPFAGS
jgi:predicted nucleic acid-binding protein